jgi:alkylated DNA repair dioxygenase AlkB
MATVNYKLIKNFFSKVELDILQKYCYNKLDANKDYQLDSQSFSPAWYKDPLMTSLLDIKLPIVEKESNLKLFQTYAYWRYYVFGADLKKHTDRPACEISVTACIKKYDKWAIVIEKTSFELEEGDAVLYSGCDQKHWRPNIYKGEGIAQVFFHYVNQNGIYKNHKYDQIRKEH